jgi:hypothetical protein
MSPAERAARERLQEAITDRNQKLEAQEAAEVAVGRAVRLRDIAQADLDDALTARNRSALASARMVIEPVLGRDDSPEVTPLPVHVAQEQLDATNEALRVLTEESDSARTATLAAETNVKRKAADVINAQVDELAQKLVVRQEDVAKLRGMITGLSYAWLQVGDVNSSWPLTEGARKALSWTEPYYVPGADPVRAMTQAWQSYLTELCESSEAGLVSLPADKKDAA